jgi:hypothetical protein
MFRIFYAEKDATLYESAEYYNTGLDEILEIGKRLNTDGSTYLKSRALVKFDLNEINATLAKYSVSANDCKFILQLFTTHAKNLPAEYSIDAKIVAQPWTNGTGFLSSTSATLDGVNWAEPHATWSFYPYTGNNWISGSNIQINGTSLYATGSGKGGSWLFQSGSGVFNASFFNQAFFYQPGLQETEGFSYRPTDINMDVTEAVLLWKSGSGGNSIANNGFLLKFSDSDENNSNVAGYVRFFSRETHTIYVPRLVMYWDDSNFISGSLSNIDSESYAVYTNIKPSYKDTEVTKIRIYARDKYPRKSPTNLFPIQTVKHLPATTYYSISDAATDEVIIPFDDIYTKVSCDSTSNFIYLDMNGFMPERNYRLNLKIVDGILEQYIDDQIYFKVVR